MNRREDVVYSKQNAYVAAGDGTTVFIRVGEVFRADDPLVRKFPSMFTADASVFMTQPSEVPS